MLTERQSQCLHAIQALTAERCGVAPSLREIAQRMGYRNAVGFTKKLVDGLIERGFVRRIDGKARAIEVIRSSAPRVAVFRFDETIKELVPLRPATHAEIFKAQK